MEKQLERETQLKRAAVIASLTVGRTPTDTGAAQWIGIFALLTLLQLLSSLLLLRWKKRRNTIARGARSRQRMDVVGYLGYEEVML